MKTAGYSSVLKPMLACIRGATETGGMLDAAEEAAAKPFATMR